MPNRITMLLTIAGWVACFLGNLSAQDDTTRRSELGIRQKLVEQKMIELETKLTVIAERLQEKEPERAQRLIAAYQQSKEQLITKKMAEVSNLLDQDQLPAAEAKLNEVIENLEALIKLLTNEKEPTLTKQEEQKMLERWKENIQERIQEQQQQRKETEKVSQKDETINRLEAQIKQLEKLIGKQREVIQDTEKNAAAGLRALDQVADKQFEVRQETEELGKQLGGEKSESQPAQPPETQPKVQPPGNQPPADSEPTSEMPAEPKSDEPKSDEPKSGEPKTGEPKTGEPKSGEPKSGEPKTGEPKSGEPKSGGPKSGEPKSGESKSGESKSGDEQPPQPPQPGQKALEKAAEHQQRAEEKLGSGKSADAKRQEQEALKEMDQALAEIQKEKRRIESLPPEVLEQMAQQQRRTRDKAMELVEEMKKAPKPKPESGEPPADSPAPQQPGQQPMEQASESMQQASDDLQAENPEDAEKKQKQSAEELAKALKEIEERLNQLREETREEKLARLEARFREMLDRQIVASVMTVELDDKRTNLGDLRRRDQLLLLQMASEENEISEIGQQAYDLLLEDGTSIVFPEIVQELRDDLAKAAQLLQDERTDRFTQLIHKEIELTIQDLLDALKEAKGKPSEGGGGGGGGGGKQPLLKNSAELKILKMQQLRLNRRTKQVDQMRGSSDLETLLDAEAQAAAEFQAKLLEMTDGIIEKSDK